MTTPIRAKVAKILNTRELVITAGSHDGVEVGMHFDIMDKKGENVTHPDTGEILGSVERPKVRVKVVQVQERIAVASTFRTKKVNEGGSMPSSGLFARALMPEIWTTKVETLKTKESTWEDLSESESYVRIGDPAVQVVEVTE